MRVSERKRVPDQRRRLSRNQRGRELNEQTIRPDGEERRRKAIHLHMRPRQARRKRDSGGIEGGTAGEPVARDRDNAAGGEGVGNAGKIANTVRRDGRRHRGWAGARRGIGIDFTGEPE